MKYDIKQICHDYQNGLSLSDLNKKYGISITYAHSILKGRGLNRNPSESMLLYKSGQITWRKLVRIPSRANKQLSLTRLLSLPASLLVQLGFSPYSELKAKWLVDGNKLSLEIKEVKLNE